MLLATAALVGQNGDMSATRFSPLIDFRIQILLTSTLAQCPW